MQNKQTTTHIQEQITQSTNDEQNANSRQLFYSVQIIELTL